MGRRGENSKASFPAGIIYVSSSELGWAPIVASWLQKRTPAESAALKPLFDTYVDLMLDFVRSACPLNCLSWTCQVEIG